MVFSTLHTFDRIKTHHLYNLAHAGRGKHLYQNLWDEARTLVSMEISASPIKKSLKRKASSRSAQHIPLESPSAHVLLPLPLLVRPKPNAS
jgi:hypothetical protein